MAPVEIIEHDTVENLTAQSRRLQDKAQAPRHRYRSGIEESAEGDEPALCFHSAPSVSAPLPQPLHHCALREKNLAKGLRFAGRWCSGSLDVPWPLNAGARLCCHAANEHNAELCKVLRTAARLPVRIISRYV